MIGIFFTAIFVWSLIIFGITQIVVESTLFSPLRKFMNKYILTKPIGRIINCLLCTSVWVAFIMSLFIYSPSLLIWPYLKAPTFLEIPFTDTLFNYAVLKIGFLDAMLGSAIVWFLHCIEYRMKK